MQTVIDRRPHTWPVSGPRAWTGGDRPFQLSTVPQPERRIISYLFREQMSVHGCFWGNVERDTARIFWKRARHDAHATFRAERGVL